MTTQTDTEQPPLTTTETPGGPGAAAPHLDARPARETYNGPVVFCLVSGEPDFSGFVFGPQGLRFLPVGRIPDGRLVGIAACYPSEKAYVQAAHPDEYLAGSWNELLARTEYAPYVAWQVLTRNRGWVAEQDLAAGDQVERTVRGHKLRRPPLADAAQGFDPDFVPAVGTLRVVSVEGADDRVQIVRTGPDGSAGWYEVQSTPAARG
ncbi:MAG: hypothetical protein JO040_01800 [Gemmatimonadetes bacterium]|nr:hypothetical protein [Gemmatimonadota bacterium]